VSENFVLNCIHVRAQYILLTFHTQMNRSGTLVERKERKFHLAKITSYTVFAWRIWLG